jgi:hypothetical protein
MVVTKRDMFLAVLILFCVTSTCLNLALELGTRGTNLNRAAILYDSGWINITDKCGQYFNVIHNLNNTDIMVDITGKTSLDGGANQRHLGLTNYISGWSKTYGGTDDDRAYALVRTTDGGYALAGYTFSYGAGYSDYWLVKTDASGNVQWSKTYGGIGPERAFALVQTTDGGYALAGDCFWLVKTDSKGNMEWNRTLGGELDEAYTLVQTSDGGYALAGYTTADVGFYLLGNFRLVKADMNGNMQWNRTYGGTGYDVAFALVQASDGGYALAGSTESYGAGGSDAWLVKTDASGNVQWNKTYGETYYDGAHALVRTTDGGYALAGFTESYDVVVGRADFWLIKMDANGTMQWSSIYGGAKSDIAWTMVQTTDGGFALAGLTGYYAGVNGDVWLVKVDMNGNMQWNKTYGEASIGGAYDLWGAYALVQAADEGYVIAGGTTSYGAGKIGFWLVKTDIESGVAWVDSDANSVTLYRGLTDPYWNFVRVRMWDPINLP